MRTFGKLLLLVVALSFAAVQPASAKTQEDDDAEGVVVGRVSYVEGQLLRYVTEEKDWIATVKDAPFSLEDSLYSDEDGKAEFIFPNNIWVRIGGSTQIQLITIQSEFTEVDVASGEARFFNKSSAGAIKVTTPFGYVLAPAGTLFDMYVGDESVEVISLRGTVDFVHEGTNVKYEVIEGSSSIVADSREVASGEGTVDADWDDWNEQRDRLWAKRFEVKGESVKYLPSELHDDAYELEESGRWERVHYEGSYHQMWRPVNVAAGWTPYSVGRWSVYYGDQCWIPDEPFGYVTHHYGSWVFVNGGWFWGPPRPRVVRVGVVAPVVGIGFGWYPGRVAWIHSGVNVGWVPLAWNEPYYGLRRWGPRTVVVRDVNVININIGRYRWVNHAVVVNQTNIYNVRNYAGVRIANINRTTIINNYRSAPVVNRTVINNYTNIRQRYNYTNVAVTRKPHQQVVQRIERNEQVARRVGRVNPRQVEQEVRGFRKGDPVREVKVQRPRVTNRIVPESDIAKPAQQVDFKSRELKKNVKSQQEVQKSLPERVGPGFRAREAEKPGRAGEVERPARPPKPGREMRETQPGEPRGRGAAGEEGRPARPPKPGKELRETQPDEPRGRGAAGEEGRPARPAKPGREMRETQPGEPRGRGAAGEEGRPARPPKPGRELREPEPGGAGRGGSVGEESRPARPPKPRGGREVEPGGSPAGRGGDEVRGATPEGSGRRVREGGGAGAGRGAEDEAVRRPRRPREEAPGEVQQERPRQQDSQRQLMQEQRQRRRDEQQRAVEQQKGREQQQMRGGRAQQQEREAERRQRAMDAQQMQQRQQRAAEQQQLQQQQQRQGQMQQQQQRQGQMRQQQQQQPGQPGPQGERRRRQQQQQQEMEQPIPGQQLPQ